MRSSEVFVLGMITGAVVVCVWRRDTESYAEEKSRGVRAKAADVPLLVHDDAAPGVREHAVPLPVLGGGTRGEHPRVYLGETTDR